ncbi:putative transposase [Gordonia amarae NBRC 15530]|uniref:Putative transposase n=1 Tax=Gordonia amarae NBRC 15530 TaxID=1075090 RepID=G7GKK4_9ACTN|nr:putative transposase [Gordonia amarae NBRC 15530]
MLDLPSWPAGIRVIVRKERPHPGAPLRFTDRDGLRLTAFATNTTTGQFAALELRHRRRARCEDRIHSAKDFVTCRCTGSTRTASGASSSNSRASLLAWAQMLALRDSPARRWEPKALRLRLFSVAARLTGMPADAVLNSPPAHHTYTYSCRECTPWQHFPTPANASADHNHPPGRTTLFGAVNPDAHRRSDTPSRPRPRIRSSDHHLGPLNRQRPPHEILRLEPVPSRLSPMPSATRRPRPDHLRDVVARRPRSTGVSSCRDCPCRPHAFRAVPRSSTRSGSDEPLARSAVHGLP